jgi:hypothetical protein
MPIATSTDEQFLAAFLSCHLGPAEFDHGGHLRIAWILLQRHPLEQAVELACSGIARLAAHLGAAEKYHRTLSEVVMHLMAHGGAAVLSWEAFLRANPELVMDLRGTIARHYSADRLNSSAACSTFVTPDRLPLPA